MMRHSLLIIVTPFVRASYFLPSNAVFYLSSHTADGCMDKIADDFKSNLYADIDTKLKKIEQHALLNSPVPERSDLEIWLRSFSFITDGKSPVDHAYGSPSDVTRIPQRHDGTSLQRAN